jgi:short-subunit dehydrogenase
MKVEGKIFVVTGAGSGMGQEITLELIKRGAKVAMADINVKGMDETLSKANVDQDQLQAFELNITDRKAVYEFKSKVIKAFGAIDGLINNAGIIQPFVPINELEIETIERVMNINFYGTLYMTKALLPHLLERPEAHISNTSSMGGFIPFPGQTAYSASKAAVKLLTEGLNSELQGTKIHVTLIFPGAVNTNITKNSGVEMKKPKGDQQVMKTLSAEDAALQIVNAIEKNKYRVMVGKDAKFLNFFYRLFPEKASLFIAKKMKQM